MQNIGGDLSFDKPDIPSNLRRRLLIGALYVVKDSGDSVLSLSMDTNPPFEDGPRYNLGAELLYAEHILLRIGYMRSTNTYYESMALYDGSSSHEERVWRRKGLTVGVGFRFRGVEVNVAGAPRREPVLNSDEKLRLEEHDPVMSFSCTARF
jgi:hypothetical protein